MILIVEFDLISSAKWFYKRKLSDGISLSTISLSTLKSSQETDEQGISSEVIA